MKNKKTDKKLTSKQSADYIKRSFSTLAVWRCKQRHLKSFKEGGRVYYWQSELDRFLEKEPKRMI